MPTQASSGRRRVRRWGARRWPHFRPAEFDLGPPRADQGVDTLLLDVLERIRIRNGNRPVTIVSGNRSPEHNAAVGGASASQHLVGRAADIPSGIVTPEEAIMCGATGVGEKDGWAIHVDVRPGPVARWVY